MANVQFVNYEDFPRQATLMREKGKQLNNEIKKAYASIESMHNSWYGKRYNELVAQFNNIIPQINQILTLVVGEIPFTLETVANNYSLADKGSKLVSALNEAPSKISSLNMPNDVGMKFLSAEVSNIQRSVNENFKNATLQMNEIAAQYDKVQWQSDASEMFKKTFNTLKNSIINSFDNIGNEFAKLMNQTQEDIQKTENANTVQ